MAIDLDLDLVHDNIDEYVNDENRIVTCKWLSLTLSLNINVAKKALYSFVKHQRKKEGSGSISVTYFVAGLGKSKSGNLEHKCIVVPEAEVDEVKKSLSVVTSCHLYSVQKAALKDYIPLYLTDYEIVKQNLSQCTSQSSIKCSWVAQRVVRQPVRALEKPGTSEKHETAKTHGTSNNAASSLETARTVSKKTQPKGSIASMFAAAGQKKVVTEVPSAATGQKKVTEVAASSKANDVRTVNGSSKTKTAEKKRGVLSFFANGDTRKSSPETCSLSGIKQIGKTQEKEIQKKETKRTVDSDDEPEKKQRKRIRTDLFDSSDEDGEDEDIELEEKLRQEVLDEDSENVMPPTNGYESAHVKDAPIEVDKVESCVEQVKSSVNEEQPKETVSNGGRKRKRTMKTVMKQFQDEEGFLVTKKEVIWESESDDSEQEDAVITVETVQSKPDLLPARQSSRTLANPKAEQRKKTTMAKKSVSPSKAKQTSLISFFKK